MKWEYKAIVLQLFSSSLTEVLNELGEKGWELVCWDAAGNGFIFKRPKPPNLERIE